MKTVTTMSKKRSNEDLKAVALNYTSYREFLKKEQSVRIIAGQRGILEEICSHMERSRAKNLTIEEVTIKAKFCKTRVEFKTKYLSEYRAAIRFGILKEVCFHMKHAKTQWTDKMLREEALKYEHRSEFQKYSKAAYLASRRRFLLDEICSHMKKPDISEPEKSILEAVRKYFPEARKFRANGLYIPGKEYIKTLEVDILVNTLGRGIEYDSNHFHSLEGLKRGHPTWKEEHLINYHDIKDKAFLALGIEIFHITQKEWDEDNQASIDKCLGFLGIKREKAA